LLILTADRGGPRNPTVFGKVTFKNVPLSGGTISFIGKDGLARADIEKDGSYRVDDGPRGPVKVAIRSVSTTLQKHKGDKMEWVAKSLIPTKFNDPKTSGLEYTIAGDRQQMDIDLKD
jgi:hypothetical protein